MFHTSVKNNISLAVGLFFICLILILFTIGVETIFPFYNPILTNPLLRATITSTGYVAPSIISPNPTSYSQQSFSYKDYYAPYPYLQLQNWSNNNYGNGSGTNLANNTGNYISNNINYSSGYNTQLTNSNIYTPFGTYQPFNAYPQTNYSTISSSTYQTVPTYPGANNTNSQISITQNGSYNQPNIQSGSYGPSSQNGYYAPSTYSPYPLPNLSQSYTSAQNLPNVYYPSNAYTQNQIPYTGYYSPNSNYWPTSGGINTPETPADIAGLYRGEWVSDTNGTSREIWADLDQTDAQVQGQIKLMGYVIESKGRTSLSGTVNGNTVSIEINLNGSILKLEGTVDGNGEIIGTYTLEGSSGSIIDEGTITLEPR